MKQSVNIVTPQTIVIKNNANAAEIITAVCAVTTLAIVAKTAVEVSDKIDQATNVFNETSEKIEKTKNAMTFKSTRDSIRNRFNKKGTDNVNDA